MIELLNNIWQVYLDTAVWLLFGLLMAGLVKAYIPEDAMQRWLGGQGFAAVSRAALFGAPLPLCSCGVLPAAIGLRRAGASREATVSFLISTPETSIDSVAVTYALLGPLMAVYRPIAALCSAIVTGLMVSFIKETDNNHQTRSTNKLMPDSCGTAACATQANEASQLSESCSSQTSCCDSQKSPEKTTDQSKLVLALRYASVDLLDDISRWMAVGIVLAGLMLTIIPPGWLAQWGGGLPAMLVMLLVGIPLYICAVASTPVAAGLLVAGVSPGAVLVFLLVGPATNLASLMLLRQELGGRVTLVYLSGIAVVSLAMGLLLEMLLELSGQTIEAKIQQQDMLLPYEVNLASGIILLLLAIPWLRSRLFAFFYR